MKRLYQTFLSYQTANMYIVGTHSIATSYIVQVTQSIVCVSRVDAIE